MSDLHKRLLKSNPGLCGLPPRNPPTSSTSNTRRTERNKREYTVIPWTKYFDSTREVLLDNGNKFRLHSKGDSGPVFLFLHGGGFSGLSWSILSSLLDKKVKCQCIAIDIRGHGETVTNNDEDLSIETMSNDVKEVVEKLWENKECPRVILVGHSMGGALAVHVAARGYLQSLAALVVIDVVEGSAMDALSSMQTYLQGRPKIFKSIEQAIEYSVRSGSIRNIESARVSIIGQLKKLVTSVDPSIEDEGIGIRLGSQSGMVMQTELAEEDENEPHAKEQKMSFELDEGKKDANFVIPEQAIEKYVWRIDLIKTETFWKEWFKGLSALFLGIGVPKSLLLAGTDRLDKELCVGQMQGKFQMQILGQCGHAVHEDSPDEVAEALANFVMRHKFAESVEDNMMQNYSNFKI